MKKVNKCIFINSGISSQTILRDVSIKSLLEIMLVL